MGTFPKRNLINSKKWLGFFDNEFIFCLYFYGFALIQPVINLFSGYSTIIVFAFIASVLLLSLARNILVNGRIRAVLLLAVFIVVLFLLDTLIRPNSQFKDYFISYIMYGALIIWLVSLIEDYVKLIYYVYIFSIVTFIVFVPAPIVGLERWGMKTYMDFGFAVALPCYLGMAFGRKYFKTNKLILLELFCILELAVYANRSCLLCVMFFWLMYYFFIHKKSKKFYLRLFVLTTISIIFVVFMYEIVLIIDKLVFSKLNIDSYAWRNLVGYLEYGSIYNLFSGRTDIYDASVAYIGQKPFLGYGIGHFHSVYGTYPHNIILDILLQFGILGLIIFIFFMTICFFQIRKTRNKNIYFVALFFLSLIMPKLLLSSYYLKDMGFWGFVTFCFIAKHLTHKKTRSETKTNEDIASL